MRVETRYGTVRAKYVVVAVPLGVITAGRIKFQPGLPSELLTGLNNLPMQVVDKIGTEFSSDVFADLPDNTLVGQYADSTTAGSFICKFMGVNMASLLVVGQLVLDLQAEGKKTLFAHAPDLVRDTFGANVAAAIARMDCNPWGTDPWAMGSWTMVKPGGFSVREQLRAPIHDRIYLAGEPYNQKLCGFTHGAWTSGEYAASQILPHV